MDRLIALVALRLRLGLRAYLRARESLVALLVALPGTLIFSGLVAIALYVGVRHVAAGHPEAVAPLLSAAATLVGIAAAFSPLLSGVALVETPDAARLAHFPVPLRTVMAATLVANLAQPAVLAQTLPTIALALALGESSSECVLAFGGVALSLLLVIAVGQVAGLVLYGLARNRRLHDLLLLVGLPLGFALAFLPFLLLALGPGSLQRIFRLVTEGDPCAVSPFAWGVRAAVFGAHGDARLALVNAGLAMLAIVATVGLSAALAERIHRAEPSFASWTARPATTRHRLWVPGSVGALIEKDLRVAWRDPGLKATLLLGLIGPFLLLFLFSRGSSTLDPGLLLFFSLVVGQSPFGSNAFGYERRGIQLLFSFPVARWKLLAAKNVVQLLLRVPTLAVLGLAAALLARWTLLPVAATTVGAVWAVAAGIDDLHSVLFPIAAPAPGQNPTARTSGGRGMGAALLAAACLPLIWLVAAPFVFLAWLPYLLELPQLWLVSLPLAFAGALAVHALLVGAAARVLSRREPRVVARLLGDA
jgi:ABC-2 type transport system permease protein